MSKVEKLNSSFSMAKFKPYNTDTIIEETLRNLNREPAHTPLKNKQSCT